jgi:hypothetical protein
MASAEKSTPVTAAPRRAHESVSRPMWHCRRRSVLPRTLPTSRVSTRSSVERPRRKPGMS